MAGDMRRARNDDQVGRPSTLRSPMVLQPQLHDLVIGAAGAEAEQARRGAGFQFGGERGQFVEQAVIVDQLVGAPHFLGDFGEPRLDAVDRGRQPLRLGQAEQRQRAIGFQFDDALHQRAGALGPKAAVEHQDAHEAGRVGLEVGGEQRVAFGIFRHRQAGAVEQLLERDLSSVVGQQMQIERDQQRPRLRQARHRRRQRGGGGMERRRRLATAAPRYRW